MAGLIKKVDVNAKSGVSVVTICVGPQDSLSTRCGLALDLLNGQEVKQD